MTISIDLSRARAIQEETRKRAALCKKTVRKIDLVCALDVSYRKKKGLSSCVVYDMKKREVVESVLVSSEARAPYIPGYFFLREIGPLIDAFRKMRRRPDIVLVNGHGYSHPRRAGIATYFGVLMDIPTIGVAKRILIGEEICRGDTEVCDIVDGGEVIGAAVRSEKEKWYVSVGYGLNLAYAVEIVRNILNSHGGSLYPMVLSDIVSKRCDVVED